LKTGRSDKRDFSREKQALGTWKQKILQR